MQKILSWIGMQYITSLYTFIPLSNKIYPTENQTKEYCDFYFNNFYVMYQRVEIEHDFLDQTPNYLNSGYSFGTRTYFIENHYVIIGSGESCCSGEERGVSS